MGSPLSLLHSGRGAGCGYSQGVFLGEMSHRLVFSYLFLDSHIHILMIFCRLPIKQEPRAGPRGGQDTPSLQGADRVGENQALQPYACSTGCGNRSCGRLGGGEGQIHHLKDSEKVDSLSFEGHIEVQGYRRGQGLSRRGPGSQEVPRGRKQMAGEDGVGLDGTGWLRHPHPSQVAFSLHGESSAVFASRADGALQGPKEGSRSGTPKWGFKATAGGGLRREECGGWAGAV